MNARTGFFGLLWNKKGDSDYCQYRRKIRANPLVSFLFEFIVAAAIPVVALVVVALLEFLIPFVPVVVAEIVAPVVAFAIFVGAEGFHVWCIREFQLTIGEVIELGLDRVVMDGLFMPVVVGELHIVGNGVGESIAFIRIFFGERFVYHELKVLAHVRELGIAFGIAQRLGSCPKGLTGGDGIRGRNFQLEIGDQEKVIP